MFVNIVTNSDLYYPEAEYLYQMTELSKSLVSNEAAAMVENPESSSRIILICEHAGQIIPEYLGSLGLDDETMSTHIGWDIGAADLSRALSKQLDATLILQRYSRLVYDCNRDFDAFDAIVGESDHVAIPHNSDLSLEQRRRRFEVVYQPFQDAIAGLVDHRLQANEKPAYRPVIVTIHSFTPLYKGQRRTLDLGILYDADTRLADVFAELSEDDTAYSSARNQPYSPKDGCMHTIITHGIKHGLLNLMLEVRNDLINDTKGQEQWAGRIAALLTAALKQLN
jgi:predicted N-formylglutamate amidohydrolase